MLRLRLRVRANWGAAEVGDIFRANHHLLDNLFLEAGLHSQCHRVPRAGRGNERGTSELSALSTGHHRNLPKQSVAKEVAIATPTLGRSIRAGCSRLPGFCVVAAPTGWVGRRGE